MVIGKGHHLVALKFNGRGYFVTEAETSPTCQNKEELTLPSEDGELKPLLGAPMCK